MHVITCTLTRQQTNTENYAPPFLGGLQTPQLNHFVFHYAIKFFLPALESLAGLLASDPASFVAMHWYIPSLDSGFRLCLNFCIYKFVPFIWNLLALLAFTKSPLNFHRTTVLLVSVTLHGSVTEDWGATAIDSGSSKNCGTIPTISVNKNKLIHWLSKILTKFAEFFSFIWQKSNRIKHWEKVLIMSRSSQFQVPVKFWLSLNTN